MLSSDLLTKYPFLARFVGEHTEDVKEVSIHFLNIHVLNELPTIGYMGIGCDQHNVYFLDKEGKGLHKMEPKEFSVHKGTVTQYTQDIPGKSIGKAFLDLPVEVQETVNLILLQNWSILLDKQVEYHQIRLRLYRPLSRYSMRELVDELREEME